MNGMNDVSVQFPWIGGRSEPLHLRGSRPRMSMPKCWKNP